MVSKGDPQASSKTGGGEGRRDDATGLADRKEMVPLIGGDNAATVRSEEARLKVKGSKEVASRVRERNGSGPGNKVGCVW
jgi:hypothetical protein